MTVAYILINTELGSEDEIQEKLIKYPEVKEAYVVYGVYDLIIKIESDTMEKIKRTVTWKIRRLDKVRSTLTMIVMN